jgi:hypothetical protein
MPAIAATVLVPACTVKPTTVQPPTGCEDVSPMHVVIGVAGRNLPAATRRTVLQAVLNQLTAQIHPDSRGLLLSVYPLDERSVASNPLRLSTPCIPPAPEPLDLKQTPTFERARQLDAYRKAVAHTQAEVQQSRASLSQFSQQVLSLQPSAAPTDIWGFLSVAADEFTSVQSADRHVIVVAPDEQIQSTYCDGCHDLRGAAVHFVAFDQPTPADEQRRRSDWSMWLARVGASGSTFTRSNEPLPVLFSASQSAAVAAPGAR